MQVDTANAFRLLDGLWIRKLTLGLVRKTRAVAVQSRIGLYYGFVGTSGGRTIAFLRLLF